MTEQRNNNSCMDRQAGEPVCYVIGAGEFGDGSPAPRSGDLLIAADTKTKRELVNSMKEEGKIGELEQYLEGIREKEESIACR